MNLLKHKNLFAASSEKGSSEWKVFNAVRGDIVDAYKVSMPKLATPKIVRFGEGRLLILKQA